MGIFREALKNASMEEKKKIALQATMMGYSLDRAIDLMDSVYDIETKLLRENMEVAGLTLVDGKYEEIREKAKTGKNTSLMLIDEFVTEDKDMKIYKDRE